MLSILYTLLLYLIQPLIWIRLWLRGYKAPAYRKRWLERYGFCRGKVQSGGLLLHSVSVGETQAAIPLIKILRQHYPNLPVTITTMTPTGSERVKSAFGNDVGHVYLPYDLPDALSRFLNFVQPRLVIIMETELWPNLIRVLNQRKIPLIIANARLSERSAQGYRKLGKFVRTILQRITLIAAQSAEDGERFVTLGLSRQQLSITGNIKFDISLKPSVATRAADLRQQWAANRPVWIAASTHDGEEAILLAAHRLLLHTFPNLLFILVPRHPERFATVKALINKSGFNFITRSTAEIPQANTQVVMGDTMGELMLLYGVADLAFIGGSLSLTGGHNPLEPAAHRIPLLMGPNIFNFKEICSKLMQRDALITVTDSQSLVVAITDLLTHENSRREYGQRALDVLRQNQGALEKLVQLIGPYLQNNTAANRTQKQE